MRWSVLPILGLMLCLSRPVAAQNNMHTISGLIAQNGSGIGEIEIALSGTKADTTTSNNAGEYTFSGLPEGEYTLTPNSDRFTFTPQQYDFTLSAGSMNTLPIFEAAIATAIPANQPPLQTLLFPNAPNPFIGHTTIRFQLGTAAPVKLEVYDLIGRQIKTLLDAERLPGQYKVRFEPDALPAGIYFFRLSTNTNQVTRPMILAH